jgi:hypothetical protein
LHHAKDTDTERGGAKPLQNLHSWYTQEREKEKEREREREREREEEEEIER